MTRRARSTRRSWSRRKGRHRASRALPRRARRAGCSARSAPIAAATAYARPKRAVRSTRRSRTRSAARLPSWASSTSPAIRPRHAGAWGGSSARCRTGLRRSCAWPASAATWRLPTASSGMSACRLATPVSPSPPSSPVRPSWAPGNRSGSASRAAKRIARSPTATPFATTAVSFRCRPARCAATWCARRCASTNTRRPHGPIGGQLT